MEERSDQIWLDLRAKIGFEFFELFDESAKLLRHFFGFFLKTLPQLNKSKSREDKPEINKIITSMWFARTSSFACFVASDMTT